jgi:hypothetical protein
MAEFLKNQFWVDLQPSVAFRSLAENEWPHHVTVIGESAEPLAFQQSL